MSNKISPTFLFCWLAPFLKLLFQISIFFVEQPINIFHVLHLKPSRKQQKTAFITCVFRPNSKQVSISPTFYEQLLRLQIPKEQNKTDSLTVFFLLLGYALVKAAHKKLVKLTLGGPCYWR